MNNDTRGYIYTRELKEQLNSIELRNLSDQTFRMRIIGKLRDRGVVIASSQKGYKIPSKQSEPYDFINHDAKIVIPMLARLKKCRDLVRLGTVNGLDLSKLYSASKGVRKAESTVTSLHFRFTSKSKKRSKAYQKSPQLCSWGLNCRFSFLQKTVPSVYSMPLLETYSNTVISDTTDPDNPGRFSSFLRR